MLSAIGDRARGMGGAFTGLADDWSAAFYNPAGAAMLEHSEIYIGGATVTPRMSYTPDFHLGTWDQVNNMPPGEYYNVDQTYVLPAGGGYAKLPDTWGLDIGLGVYTPVDNNTRWNIFDPPYPTGTPFPDRDVESDINVWNFQPTFGYQIVPDRFSLGVGMSIQYSEFQNHRVQLVSDPGPDYQLPPYPLGVMFADSYLMGDGWGFGYNVGALAKMDMWSFGVSFRSESVIKLDGTSEARLWGQDGRDRSLGLESSSLLEQDLYGGKVHTARQETDFELTLPPSLSAGVAFFPNDRLTLTGDFSYTWYSQISGIPVTKGNVFDFKLGDPTDPVVVPVAIAENYTWKDQYRVAVGAEYAATERLTLRSGWYFEPSPIAVTSLTPLYGDIGDKWSPSLGASFDLGKYTFSYSYGVVFYGSRTSYAWTDSALPGTYDNVQHESFFSLRYRW